MTRSDAAHCRRIARSHARTFWLASRLLPANKRRAAFAVYAFCRVADDMVDVNAQGPAVSAERLLAGYRRELDDAMRGTPKGAVFRELALATRRYGIPPRLLYELLDGVARDYVPPRYERWTELSRYCEGVASSVGEMCVSVFGVAGDADARARANEHARTLGVAMQLTNVLRDVGEDALRGRCYLPESDLAQFSLSRAAVLDGGLAADERWRGVMRFEIARARKLYALAMPGIPLLSPDARACATACAVGYARILDAIEAIDYDTFGTRARLGTMARAAVLWSAWRAGSRNGGNA